MHGSTLLSDIHIICSSKMTGNSAANAHSAYPLSSTLRAPSTILLTSSFPFFTTSSICLCAFCKSSGRTFFSSSIFRNFFWCACRALRILASASSAVLFAVATAAARDSPVGGGTVMVRVVGASGPGPWGTRE